MAGVLLIALIIVLTTLAQQTRRRRHKWLRDLGLVGTWECVLAEHTVHLDIRGGPGAGDYEERLAEGGRLLEKGAWEIRGYDFCFMPLNAPVIICELRAFADGSIGLHGGARAQRIYERRSSNVVPLRRRN